MTDAPGKQLHEIFTYRTVGSRLDHLEMGGMDIETRGPLVDALNRLSCIPFVSYLAYGCESLSFVVGGEEAGTLCEPKVDVILKHSKPSPFGRGEETVVDETYRRGHEVTGADIAFPDKYQYDNFKSRLEKLVSATLFVPRQAKVKLYKLAIYREGGHFDWHVDTTHSNSHHATILVALNTSWTGGDFNLRRNDVETRMDMKPKITHPSPGSSESHKTHVDLGVVAFYTDTEHRVEPITDGVRIVLQYDVEVEGWVTTKDPTTQDKPQRKKHKAMHGRDEEEDEEDSPLYNLRSFYKDRKAVLPKSAHMGDSAVIDEIVNVIGRLLTVKGKKEQEEVAFALQYLYRKSSILPEYLKGSDSLLYQALSKTFEVSLCPVVLYERSDYEGRYRSSGSEFSAYIFPHYVDDGSGNDTDDDGSSYSDDGPRYRWGKKGDLIFHLPRSSAIQHISRRDYVEHAGNEAIFGEGKYFGGGMFVKAKAA